ncbi:MAG: FAD-dependent oxidoreductase [Bacillota bacterium]
MVEENKIEIYTKDWCPYCRRTKAMLKSLGLEYKDFDVTDDDEMYEKMVERSEEETVPQIFINNEHLGGYEELIEKLTSGEFDEIIEIDRPDCKEKDWDLAIIGAGPAGMTAAVYAARKGLKVLLISRDIGGQVLETDTIDNYLPEYGSDGPDLMQRYLEHVREYDVDLLFGEEIKDIKHGDKEHKLITKSGKEINTQAVIIASGSKKRHLGISGENELKDKGVSYCATCDGFLYESENVIVVGGGNSGMEAAIDMLKLGSKVFLVEYSERLNGDKHLQEKVKESEDIEIFTAHETVRINGENEVEGATIKDVNTGKEKDIEAKAVFIEVGLIPNTGFICEKLKINEDNEIIIDEDNQTSIEGIFAAGDVTDIRDKQIVISAAEGAKAALRVVKYLN